MILDTVITLLRDFRLCGEGPSEIGRPANWMTRKISDGTHLVHVYGVWWFITDNGGEVNVERVNVDQRDTDDDGFGNVCDCDFDNNGTCTITDFNVFLPDFTSATDSGTGTDMDGDGSVGIADFNLFLPGFQAGAPGPSGLAP